MRNYLCVIALAALACAPGRAAGEEEAAMKPWEEIAEAMASEVAVSKAEARLGASGVIFVDVEIDHQAVAAGGISTLDTGITAAALAAATHPVQLRITVPALEGRYWWGEYDAKTGKWVGMATHARPPHPDLEPRLDEATGTFVVALPAEG